MSASARWRSRCVREPFRLFFVTGLVAGIAGVAIWPVYHWGLTATFSGAMHARHQIHGFLGSFVIGFLTTAIPRLLGAPGASLAEVSAFVLLVALNLAAQWLGMFVSADGVFLLALLLLLVFGGRRFANREDFPPPSFVLVLAGILHAIAGLAVNLWVALHPSSAALSMLGQNLVNQGFILNLILGVGSFLFPRFLGFEPRVELIESRAPPPGWWPRAIFFIAVVGAIFSGFLIEFLGHPSMGQSLRAVVASIVFIKEARLHRRPQTPGCLPHALRWALVLAITGLWAPVFFPAHRVALLHITFIGGFSLITLVVATRVILGHSGFEHLFKSRMVFIAVLATFFTMAAALRVWADWLPAAWFLTLAGASLLWLTGVAIWAAILLPRLFYPRSEAN